MIQLPVAFYKGVLIPLIRGVQCPTCREWALVRVASISFGDRFYRCESCGQRCKRNDHESPWLDANASEDDDMYKPIPYFGPARKREALMRALKGLGVVVAALCCGAVGWLIGGENGASQGAFTSFLIGYLFFSNSQRTEKSILPPRPLLWDREIDV